MRKRAVSLGVAFVAIAFLVLVAMPASAQYVPGPLVCDVDDTTLVPGQSITVGGSGFPPNSQVTVTLEGGGNSANSPTANSASAPQTAAPGDIVLGTAQTDDAGSFSKTFVVPADLPPGSYSCGCSSVLGETVTVPIKVIGVVAPDPGTAFTGSSINVPLWVLLIAVLLALGVVFVALGSRLQTRASRT